MQAKRGDNYTETMTVEAPSAAAFARYVLDLAHETRADITAAENGRVWARLSVSPMTDFQRAAFPLDRDGVRGDTRKRGQSGVMFTRDRGPLLTVIERARRMWSADN